MRTTIEMLDITKLQVDAIVNAANKALCGGGGVDGAIHRAAGPKLLERCRTLGGCETGEAKITEGYNLPAKYIIHTVGPVWDGGANNEEQQLVSCYRNSLKLAMQYGVKSIAFPAISCGAYRFPISKACKIAVTEVAEFQSIYQQFEDVIFACFDKSVKRELIKANEQVSHD